MEVGRTYRFTDPSLLSWGEWEVARIDDSGVWDTQGRLMCYTSDFNSGGYGQVAEVNVGPEPYEEWFK